MSKETAYIPPKPALAGVPLHVTGDTTTDYFTLKSQVKNAPGYTTHYTPGKGYYTAPK